MSEKRVMGIFRCSLLSTFMVGLTLLFVTSLAQADALVETVRHVKLGNKSVDLVYEKNPTTRRIVRLTVKSKGWQEVYEDTRERGYFDLKLVTTKNTSIRFFNLYHGQFQNMEITRQGKKASLKVVMYLDEKSGQYRRMLQHYELNKNLADSANIRIGQADMESTCPLPFAVESTADKITEKAYMAVVESRFDKSCEDKKFAPFVEQMKEGVAHILMSQDSPSSKNFLACLRNGNMADIADKVAEHIKSENFPKIKCAADPENSGALAEYISGTDPHVEVYYTPKDGVIHKETKFEYASTIFHEFIHSTGISNEIRTKRIETCCSEYSAEPERSSACQLMKKDTDFYDKLYGYADALQKLDSFPSVWGKIAFGKQSEVAENEFVDIFSSLEAMNSNKLAAAESCLKTATPDKKGTCFSFASICTKYSAQNSDRENDCNLQMNDLASVFQQNLEKQCSDSLGTDSCLAKALAEANKRYLSAAADQKSNIDDFTNYPVLQGLTRESVNNSFVVAIANQENDPKFKATYAADIQALNNIKQDDNDRTLHDMFFEFANFLRDREEIPGGTAEFNSCIGSQGSALQSQRVLECLSSSQNKLGASGVYRLCTNSKVVSDFECSNLALHTLNTELEKFTLSHILGDSKNGTSVCTNYSTAAAPSFACRQFRLAFQNLISDVRANCPTSSGGHTSFACWDQILNGAAVAQKVADPAALNDVANPELWLEHSYITGMDQIFSPDNFSFYEHMIDTYNPKVVKDTLVSYYRHFGLPNANGDMLVDSFYSSCMELIRDLNGDATKKASCFDTGNKAFLSDTASWFAQQCPSFYAGSGSNQCQRMADEFIGYFQKEVQRHGVQSIADSLYCGDENFRKLKDGEFDLSKSGCKIQDVSKKYYDYGASTVAINFNVLQTPSPVETPSGSSKISSASSRTSFGPQIGSLPLSGIQTSQNAATLSDGKVVQFIPLNPDDPTVNRQVAVQEMTNGDTIGAIANHAVASAGKTLNDSLGIPSADAAEFASAGISGASSSSARENYNQPASAATADASSTDAQNSYASTPQTSRYSPSRTQPALGEVSSKNHLSDSVAGATADDTGVSGSAAAMSAALPTSASYSAPSLPAAKRTIAGSGGGTQSTGANSPGTDSAQASSFAYLGGGAVAAADFAVTGNGHSSLSSQQILELAVNNSKKFEDLLGEKTFQENLSQQKVLVMYKNHSFGNLSAQFVLRFDESTNSFILVKSPQEHQ